jgi:hypothetical protein
VIARVVRLGVMSFKLGCYFGYPTDCASRIFWFGPNFMTLAKAGRSTEPPTTVASPSDAQNRYTFSPIKPTSAAVKNSASVPECPVLLRSAT